MRSYDGFNAYGTGTIVTAVPVALSATRALVNVRIPMDAKLESVEARLNTIAGGPATAVLTGWRDSAGDELFFEAFTSTIALGTTAGRGGVAWAPARDHHPDASSTTAARTGWPGERYVDLWLGIALNAGTANLAALVVNWKG